MSEVASFTDAWIETFLFGSGTSSAWSHLLQMRGLKRIKGYINASGNMSHLLQMRGLKHVIEIFGR